MMVGRTTVNALSLGKLTKVEADLLKVILRELRKANARREQMQIFFDPFTAQDGAYLTMSRSEAGYTVEFNGAIGKAREKRVRK